MCKKGPFVLWGRDSQCELRALKMHEEAVGMCKVERRGGGAWHRSDDGMKGVSAAGERVCSTKGVEEDSVNRRLELEGANCL